MRALTEWTTCPRAAALTAVRSALESVMLDTPSGRKEAAAGLRDAIAALPVTPSAARRNFAAMLPSRRRPRGAESAARALLAFACERRPR